MTHPTAGTAVKKRRLDWLRPPKGAPDGTMSLMEHLKELRYRVTVAFAAIVVMAILAAFFYEPIIAIILKPFYQAGELIQAANPDAQLQIVTDGVISPFTLAIIACAVGGFIMATPVWMYQVWAFIAPGLVRTEKKYALMFLGAAVPLFLAGCFVGYWILPKGIAVMLGFTPQGMDITNLLELSRFLSFELRIIAIFGVSFLLPVIIIAMNLMGVVKGYQLGKARKVVIFLTFVFAAAATPSVDPFSMLALSVPMTLLYLLAEVICRSLDKRKGITAESVAEWQIDVADDT